MKAGLPPFVTAEATAFPTLSDRLRGLLFGLILTLGIFLALVLPGPFFNRLNLPVGAVSGTDVSAPQRITYISQVLTERARERAATAVQDVYDPPLANIARTQMGLAREIVDYIESIRRDPYASMEQRIAWVVAVPDLNLSATTIRSTVNLSQDAWQQVARELLVVLDRAMREEIREGQLLAARRVVPALVSLELNEEEAGVASEFVRSLLEPNAFLDVDKTGAERQTAREGVEPVSRTIEAGEVIVRAGEIVDELDMEALQTLGLLRQPQGWPGFVGQFMFALLMALGYSLAVYQFRPTDWLRRRQPWLIVLLVVAFALVSRLMVPTHAVLPYLFPLATLAMLMGVLVDLRFSLVSTVLLVFVVGYMTDGSMEIMTYLFMGSLIGTLILRQGERLVSFVLAGLAVILTNLAVLAAFRLPAGNTDLSGVLELVSASVINGGLSASLTIIGLLLISPLFGVLTVLQLMDLSRPTHPLLRQLLLTAPGTYHHTLLVGNMAERAAAAIGADAFLTRVGSFYHDIGKMSRPYFFVENQADGPNPHDHLDPETSAQIIVGHVTEGTAMAKAHRLPGRIQDFIREHHGTSLLTLFYRRACEERGEAISEEPFRYLGPRPRSKETAVLMLADICEAAVRARQPATVEETDQLVARLIGERLTDGELDASNLTLRDLDRIRETFTTLLHGINHPRVDYPDAPVTPYLPEPAARSATEAANSGDVQPVPEQALPSGS